MNLKTFTSSFYQSAPVAESCSVYSKEHEHGSNNIDEFKKLQLQLKQAKHKQLIFFKYIFKNQAP